MKDTTTQSFALGIIMSALAEKKPCAICTESHQAWRMMACQPSIWICEGCVLLESTRLAELMPSDLGEVIERITSSVKENAEEK